ncbi:PD-(D/E)XK nuclease domain-containing protein [Holdemania filiformis]|uniref:PD-(D/E)XK nuclease domain-containing protein n=1 Tax=Holdemania filiformis TaxID=61171 RepID=UPI002431B1C4|nr:PD-(D/E)XK nuclease domain-containing protein [Holdemania filiformis]
MQSASYYDTVGESFYHGLVLGLCAMMDHRYDITSNRESGEGRYDIQLMPKMKQDPGILIELKAADKASEQELHALAEAALEQIEERRYDTEMIARGMISILKYGVAFSGKHAVVKMKQTSGKK